MSEAINSITPLPNSNSGCGEIQKKDVQDKELQLFDFNKDGKLDVAERAALEAYNSNQDKIKFDFDKDGKLDNAEKAAYEAYNHVKNAEKAEYNAKLVADVRAKAKAKVKAKAECKNTMAEADAQKYTAQAAFASTGKAIITTGVSLAGLLSDGEHCKNVPAKTHHSKEAKEVNLEGPNPKPVPTPPEPPSPPTSDEVFLEEPWNFTLSD